MNATKEVVVLTDSVACLTQELVEQNGIRIIPLYITSRDRVYREYYDISTSQAYELIEEDPEHFSTSPPTPDDYVQAFRELSDKNIFCVTVSSGLSTTYNVAMLAKEQIIEENPKATIELFDSKLTIASEGLIALAAARTANMGKDIA